VRFLKSRLALSCCLVVLACNLRTLGQIGSEIALPGTERTTALPGQEFHCHTHYPLAQCQKDILQLKRMLTHYPIEGLGHWTWVLVRSQDWKPISQMLRLNPDSPAFTAVEPRETFLEEALFLHDPLRTAELMDEWRRSMPKLLELAVTHELGHAFCEEPNEAAADHFGEELRNGRLMRCRISREPRRKRVGTAELHGLKANALRAP
jgi:hypothetical protein